VSAYVAAALSGARRTLSVPGELVVRAGFYLVILVVFSSLWRAAVDASGGTIAGYGYVELLWYIAAAEAAVIAPRERTIEEIGDAVGSGSVAIEMLRPVAVVGLRLSIALGEALARWIASAVVGVVFLIAFVGGPPDAGMLFLAVPAALLGIALNLAAQHAFAGAAFWLQDTKAAWFLYQKLVFLLGGMLLPLELLPPVLADVARLLPFWGMSYVPARLAYGDFEPWLLAVQTGWLAAAAATAALVFQAGERRFQVAGG
jgi:ABC-2 type transport system permease protein